MGEDVKQSPVEVAVEYFGQNSTKAEDELEVPTLRDVAAVLILRGTVVSDAEEARLIAEQARQEVISSKTQ